MEENLKKLLLIDLSGRLLYGVICHIRYKTGEPCYGKLTPLDIKWFLNSNIESIKPYLRPMSSMTEEELDEYESIKGWKKEYELIDWLNKRHFDYRGLIEKGLALEALEGTY